MPMEPQPKESYFTQGRLVETGDVNGLDYMVSVGMMTRGHTEDKT